MKAYLTNDGSEHGDTDKANSFSTNDFSIRPFGYRVIRPSKLFTEDTIEMVLMLRERTLSLIEHFRAIMLLEKSGDYYVFQDNQHIEDLGSPLIAESGLGVAHNAILEDLLGRVDNSPFTSDSDALSLLDRRFFIQDEQLDEMCPAANGISSGLVSNLGGTPYTAYEDRASSLNGQSGSLVRPLLLDHVEVVLNDRDRFRDLRNTWINYRVHRTEGLLAQIRQFDRQLSKRLKEMREYVLRMLSQG